MKIVFTTSYGLYAFLIRLFTLGKYSHCGVVIDDVVYQAKIFKGVYKSKYDSSKWKKEIEINISDINKLKCIKYLDKELGCGYDLIGAIRFVLPFLKSSRKRWFCSELVVAALKVGGIVNKCTDAHRFSPQGTFYILVDYLIDLVRKLK